MAIMDSKLLLSDAQAITTLASTASSNVIDQYIGKDFYGTAQSNVPGIGGNLWLNVWVDTAFTNGTPSVGTLTAKLVHCATEGGTYTGTGIASAAVVGSSLVAGYKLLRVKLPPGLSRYIAVRYVTATSGWTAGKVNAWVGLDTESIL